MRIRKAGRYCPKNRPRILVTGFGPFPGMVFNASEALVEDLETRKPFSRAGGQVHTAILPTDWRKAPEMARALLDVVQPDAVLHFGVSRRTRAFEIETRAFNMAHRAEDCSGCRPRGFYVRPGGPPLQMTTLPARLVLSRLRSAELPASLSADAGRYLCNAVLFETLLKAQQMQRPPYTGFVHLPALTPYQPEPAEYEPPACSLGWETLKSGLEVIINTMLLFVRNRERPPMPAERNGLRNRWA